MINLIRMTKCMKMVDTAWGKTFVLVIVSNCASNYI